MSLRRHHRFVGPCGVLLLLTMGHGAATGDEPRSRRERPDDPPAAASRTLQPRTPGAVIVRGNHRSVQVNVDANQQNIVGDAANEPTIAVSPYDPDNIAIVWRQFDSVSSNFRQAGYAYTFDGGETWTFPGVLTPGQFRSDPVLAPSSTGFFLYSLNAADSADLFLSGDGGMTWIGPISALGGDKPWMTVDMTGSVGDGNVYATWDAQFTCCAPGTDFTRSVDPPDFGSALSLPAKVYWGTLDVDAEGDLYLAGLVDNRFAVLKSTDAKDRFIPTPSFSWAQVDLGGFPVSSSAINPDGLVGQVWIAVDRSSGPLDGNVYVLSSAKIPFDPDPLDVFFVRSTDGGQTWDTPVRVNDDPPASWAAQWFGTMSVAPNGRIDVIWNDTRNDPEGLLSEVYYAYSIDAGTTWSSGLPVTPAWNPHLGWPNQSKIGDYYHMRSDDHGAGLAFAATFNGEQDVYFLRLGDCNATGEHDSVDIAAGTSADCNANGVPDECEENVACTDTDGDGVPDETDCAPADPLSFGVPGTVAGVAIAGDKSTISWSSAAAQVGPGVRYDVARGTIGQFPVGTGPDETCLADEIAETSVADGAAPTAAPGVYYLVRASNACGVGDYGALGAPRSMAACP